MAQDTVQVRKPLSLQDKKNEYIRCMTDIPYFARTYCKVHNKATATKVAFELLPHQYKVVDALVKFPENVISKYRQGGITTLTCMFLAHYINFTPNVKVAVVADKLNLAKNSIFKLIIEIMNGLPDWLRVADGNITRQDYMDFSNGSQLQAFAAGRDGLRGFSPDMLFVDEAAFLTFGDDFMTSTMGTLAAGGRVILNSTPHGLDTVYWATIDSALNGRNNYNVVEIYWYEDPRFTYKDNGKGEYDLRWVKGDEVLENVPQERFKELKAKGYKPTSGWFINQCAKFNNDPRRIAQELENGFLGSGSNMIDAEIITRLESDEEQGKRKYIWANTNEDGKYWKYAEPVEGARYVLAADVAFGNSEDYSTIQVLRVDEGVYDQVAEYQVKMAPDMFGEKVYRIGMEYNEAYVIIDITGSIGAITMAKVIDLGYTNIHFQEVKLKPVRDRLANYAKRSNDDKELIPGFVIGANRPFMLEDFTNALRDQELWVHSTRSLSEFKTMVYNPAKKRWDHQRSAHDDLLIALAMAVYVLKNEFDFKRSDNLASLLSLAGARVSVFSHEVTRQKHDEQNKGRLWKADPFNNPNIRGGNGWM